MKRKTSRVCIVAGALASLLALSACGSSGSSSGSASPKGPIVIGVVDSLTGGNASDAIGVSPALKGIADQINSAGGIAGHTVHVDIADDASSLAQNLTAVHSLVSRGAKVIIEASQFGSESYPFLEQSKIPTFGLGIDSPIWADPSAKNFFPVFGSFDPAYPPFSTDGQYFKASGAKRVAILAYGIPAAAKPAVAAVASMKHAGLQVVYQNVGLTPGSIDFSSVALAAKQANADSVLAFMSSSDCISVAIAFKQAGISTKAMFFGGGYGQSTLADKAASAALQGATIDTVYAPVELRSAATKTFQSVMLRYAHITGIPELGAYQAYIMMNAAITALKRAAPNFTSDNIITKMRNDTDFTGAGLLPSPVNFSEYGDGDGEANGNKCFYAVILRGPAFAVANNGRPLCGTKVAS